MDPQKPALFDLDASLADYAGAMRRDMARYSDLQPPYPLHWEQGLPPYVKNLMNLIRERPGWWRNLEQIAAGFQVLDEAIRTGFDIHVLTKSPQHIPSAASEKVHWVREHIGPQMPNGDTVDIHISDDKSLVYGRMLYDDYPVFMDAWLGARPRGLGIMPVNEFNADYRHEQVVRWDGTNFEEVQERMQEAFERE